MVTITYILAAVILLGLCIFIHELGHLLGGKMVGIKAKIFSIGYGKGFIKKQIGETTYQITLIPFGGYCQFYGEDASEERKGEAYEFLSAHPFRRIVTVIMGPLFNLFFGIALFFIMNLAGYSTETNKINIPEYFKTGDYVSPAYTAGMKTGDTIVEISGSKISRFSDIQSSVLFSDGLPLEVKAEREDGGILKFMIKPEKYTEKGHYTIGVLPYGNRVLIVSALEGDVADKAGFETMDEVKSINGIDINSPAEFTSQIKSSVGKEIKFKVLRSGNEVEITAVPRLREVLNIKQFEDNRFKDDKFDVVIDKIDLIKNAINKKKLKINGSPVQSFSAFQTLLARNKNKIITLENNGGIYRGIMEYESYGFIGVETANSPDMKEIRYGLVEGFIRALTEPYEFIVMNIKGMGMLFSGDLDVRENLSGPIRIAKIAGDVAYYRGYSAFILLMAKISIILMVMNLLPIPVVDGSLIVFFLIEAVRGKPLSDKIMEKIQYVGIILLVLLGIFVVFNDLSFLPFFQKLFN